MMMQAGRLVGLGLVLAFHMAPCAGGGAGWHDPNIVSVGHEWQHVPAEYYGTPHAPYDDRWSQDDSTIVVLVAGLRETRLGSTLLSAFDNAALADRIRFVVVQQNLPEDEDCLAEVCRKRGFPLREVPDLDGGASTFHNPNGCVEFDKVRVLRMHASEAAGPVYARGRQPELLQDEDFCMQIDAHTIFKENWDLMLLREWAQTKNEFAVLSTYPTNYKDLDKNSNKHWEMPHICGVHLSGGATISNKQASAAANLDRPLLAPLWAAGLSFSRCHAERWVPNDVHLRQIFSGEEFSRGARLWTHGYDFYSITRPTIGVYYGGDKGGKGGWQHDSKEAVASSARLKTLLQFPGSDQSPEAVAALGKFGLGTRRTLDQYIAFSGVDTRNVHAEDHCLVEYVPWDDAGLRERILSEEKALRRADPGSPLRGSPRARRAAALTASAAGAASAAGTATRELGMATQLMVVGVLVAALLCLRVSYHRLPRIFKPKTREA